MVVQRERASKTNRRPRVAIRRPVSSPTDTPSAPGSGTRTTCKLEHPRVAVELHHLAGPGDEIPVAIHLDREWDFEPQAPGVLPPQRNQRTQSSLAGQEAAPGRSENAAQGCAGVNEGLV